MYSTRFVGAPELRGQMAAAVWTHCTAHLWQVGRPRTSSLAVLVQLLPLLLSEEGQMLKDLGQDGSHGFWELLRACLVSWGLGAPRSGSPMQRSAMSSNRGRKSARLSRGTHVT